MALSINTTCCIAGGGPAGMMLGFLLARAGVDVTVLEKHADFLRDFRGDTVHPSTLELIYELGLIDEFSEAAPSKTHPHCGEDRCGERGPGRFFAPADTLQVHRADATMGFPQFPG